MTSNSIMNKTRQLPCKHTITTLNSVLKKKQPNQDVFVNRRKFGRNWLVPIWRLRHSNLYCELAGQRASGPEEPTGHIQQSDSSVTQGNCFFVLLGSSTDRMRLTHTTERSFYQLKCLLKKVHKHLKCNLICPNNLTDKITHHSCQGSKFWESWIFRSAHSLKSFGLPI